MSTQHQDDQPAELVRSRPFVISDIGPDGRPQAMLVTPATETIVDRETARALIADLLAALATGTLSSGIPRARIADAIADSLNNLS